MNQNPKDKHKTGDDRPTEDDIAQAKLGGPKGHPSLQPAPLTRREKEQMPTDLDPGHVS